MKRFLSLILALVSVFALCFTLTACGEKETATLIYEEQDDGTLMVTGVSANETEIYIPSKKDGKTVTAIDSSAFRNNTTVKKVVLPSSVTFIDNSAFEGASALESINLEKVEILGKAVFKDAFGRVPKVELKLSSLMSMGTGCFELALGLKKATISGPIVEIPVSAFSGCSGLQTVALGSYVKTLSDSSFASCVSLETINLQNVQHLGINAFKSCNSLESVNLSNVKRIMDGAFYQCGKLATVVVGNKLCQFYPLAFTDCVGLTYFEIGNYDDEWCYFMAMAGTSSNAGTGVISDSGYAQGSSNKITDNMSDPALWASIIKESDKYNANSCFITKTWVSQKGLQIGPRYSYLEFI